MVEITNEDTTLQEQHGNGILPCVNGSLLDKSLLFERTWRNYKIKTKCKVATTLGKELANCYKIAKLIGYENYKRSGFELN